jgi:hypothetical protein
MNQPDIPCGVRQEFELIQETVSQSLNAPHLLHCQDLPERVKELSIFLYIYLISAADGVHE